MKPGLAWLFIFDRVPANGGNIALHIHPEGKYEIDDEGRAHGKKGDIDKPGADAGRGNTQSVANGGTNAKCLPFNEASETIHTPKLKFCAKMYNTLTFPEPLF